MPGREVGPGSGPSFIDSFRVGHDGRLTAAPGSPFPAQRVGPFGSEFRPTNPNQLFVSNAHDGGGNGSVSAYTVGKDAALTAVGGSPFADDQTAPCWVEISHDGKYLFAINTGSSSISRYSDRAERRHDAARQHAVQAARPASGRSTPGSIRPAGTCTSSMPGRRPSASSPSTAGT